MYNTHSWKSFLGDCENWYIFIRFIAVLAICVLAIFAFYKAGDEHGQKTVLSGTTTMRLVEHADGTIDWVNSRPPMQLPSQLDAVKEKEGK